MIFRSLQQEAYKEYTRHEAHPGAGTHVLVAGRRGMG